MATSEGILVTTSIYLALSVLIGFGLFRLVTKKGKAEKSSDYGRKWLAWVVFLASIAILPRLFRDFGPEPLIQWLIIVIFYGAIAFIFGVLYGKFTLKLNSRNSSE